MSNYFRLFVCMSCLVLGSLAVRAQELHATVSVTAGKIRSTDPGVFRSLQQAVTEFLNTRRWTNEVYGPGERIECNFLLDLQDEVSPNVYRGTLTIQSIRPVYNSAYSTNMFNYQDKNFTFKYVQYQPLNFSDTRVSGNDPLQSNLTAILAYYAYIIIGLDRDSFADHGGMPLFKKSQNIVSGAPEDSKSINGWKAFEGTRNRYWLVENLLSTRLNRFHGVMYEYHRLGLDLMYEDMNKGRAAILDGLTILNAINADNPNTMILQLFFLSKSDELQGIFSKAPSREKTQAVTMLSQLDPANSGQYGQLMK